MIVKLRRDENVFIVLVRVVEVEDVGMTEIIQHSDFEMDWRAELVFRRAL